MWRGDTNSAVRLSRKQNIHLHCLVLDGVYQRNVVGDLEFVESPAPSDEALQEVLRRIIGRLMKLLVRRGILVEDQGELYMADAEEDSDEAGPLGRLQAGSAVYRIAFGERAGQKVLTIKGAGIGNSIGLFYNSVATRWLSD